MPQNEKDKSMSLQLPPSTYKLVFNKALDMSKDKNRKVPLTEAAIKIIDEWGKREVK